MIKLLSTIALCASMTPAVAMAEAESICPTMGTLAETIMTARQGGIALSQILNGPSGSEFVKEMAHQAYAKTRWHGEAAQLREIQDFREQWEIACYNGEIESQ